jgi:hypothetical protein
MAKAKTKRIIHKRHLESCRPGVAWTVCGLRLPEQRINATWERVTCSHCIRHRTLAKAP